MISFFKTYDLPFTHNLNSDQPIIKIFGELMGVVFERKVYSFNDTLKLIEDAINKENKKILRQIIRGVVGQCFIEIKKKKCTELWASCSSSGFVFGVDGHLKKTAPLKYNISRCTLYCSNNEGEFYSIWREKVKNNKISQDAIMNAIMSHQSVIRPPFDGLYSNTYRCQPGCMLRITDESIEMDPFIILDKDELINQKDNFSQEDNLSFAIEAVVGLYKEKKNSKINIAFSGGIDSVFLMLAFKNNLSENSLIYINYEKNTEKKLASYIAKHEGFKIKVINKSKTINLDLMRKFGSSGLSTFNSIGMLKYNFSNYRFLNLENNGNEVLTGQNADLLFHVDHFGPDNRVSLLTRIIKIIKSAKYRKNYTMPFYKGNFFLNFFSLFEFSKKKQNTLGKLVIPSLVSLAEHNYPFNLSSVRSKDEILQRIINYRIKNYYDVFTDYFLNKYQLNLNSTKIKDIDPKISNHIVRTIRWFRTVGSIQQQFHNISKIEKVNNITTYSEGPLANIFLNWQLNYIDIFSIKRFSQKYIQSKLGIKYSKIRLRAIGLGVAIKNNLKSFIPYKTILKKILNRSNKINISTKDLLILKDILSNNGVIERKLVNYTFDNSYKNYLNFLYDCIEQKTPIENLSNVQSMQICRLVNLQIMLDL